MGGTTFVLSSDANANLAGSVGPGRCQCVRLLLNEVTSSADRQDQGQPPRPTRYAMLLALTNPFHPPVVHTETPISGLVLSRIAAASQDMQYSHVESCTDI